jgi:hypothetical protein
VDPEVVEGVATNIIKINCFSSICYLPYFVCDLLLLLFFFYSLYIFPFLKERVIGSLNRVVKNR